MVVTARKFEANVDASMAAKPEAEVQLGAPNAFPAQHY